MNDERRRGSAEWVSFAIAWVLLIGFVGALVWSNRASSEPAAPVVATVGAPRQDAGLFYVTAAIVNRGGETATNVQVTAELRTGEEMTMADQVIDFLAGDETEEVVFAFATDPAQGELRIDVSSYTRP